MAYNPQNTNSSSRVDEIIEEDWFVEADSSGMMPEYSSYNEVISEADPTVALSHIDDAREEFDWFVSAEANSGLMPQLHFDDEVNSSSVNVEHFNDVHVPEPIPHVSPVIVSSNVGVRNADEVSAAPQPIFHVPTVSSSSYMGLELQPISNVSLATTSSTNSAVLLQEPISSVPLSRPSLTKPQDQSSCYPITRGSGTVTKTWDACFELFQQDRGYLLKVLEIGKGIKSVHSIFVRQHPQKLVVDVRICSSNQPNNDIPPLLLDITNPPVGKRYDLTLEERLNGWTVIESRRNGHNTGTQDKSYKNAKCSTTFRSMVEVGVFILYSCQRKDLVHH